MWAKSLVDWKVELLVGLKDDRLVEKMGFQMVEMWVA